MSTLETAIYLRWKGKRSRYRISAFLNNRRSVVVLKKWRARKTKRSTRRPRSIHRGLHLVASSSHIIEPRDAMSLYFARCAITRWLLRWQRRREKSKLLHLVGRRRWIIRVWTCVRDVGLQSQVYRRSCLQSTVRRWWERVVLTFPLRGCHRSHRLRNSLRKLAVDGGVSCDNNK